MTFNPITILTNALSPVEITVKATNHKFGRTASVDIDVTSTVKATGIPADIPMDISVDGAKIASATPRQGKFTKAITFKEAGSYTVDVTPADSKQFAQLFGPILPTGSTTVSVAEFKANAVNEGLGTDMDVPISVAGKSFRTGESILFPLKEEPWEVAVRYPRIADGVYSLDPEVSVESISQAKSITRRYNAPSVIEASLELPKDCIAKGETLEGTLSMRVLDVGSKPFGGVPIRVGSAVQSSDLNTGEVSMPVEITSPGSATFSAKTDTIISAATTVTRSVPLCAPPPPVTQCGPVIDTVAANPSAWNGKTVACTGCGRIITARINNMAAIYRVTRSPYRGYQTIGAWIACHPWADGTGWYTLI